MANLPARTVFINSFGMILVKSYIVSGLLLLVCKILTLLIKVFYIVPS